jgi:chromosomal replication initiator protein
MAEMAEKTATEVWSEAMEAVERNLGQTDILLRQTRAQSLTDEVLTVTVPNIFAKDSIEQEHLKQIHTALRRITGKDIEVKFIVQAEVWAEYNESPSGLETSSRGSVDSSALNPKYTFDSFVVGPSNRFSYTASLAVAESPGKVYNPLYIYGRVGLGKTHLMYAIGNSIKDTHENLKVSYMSSEEFTNEMIESLRRGMPMSQFRNKYRTVDVLLIDDIQFIRGKDGTQEEFFYTFNALYNAQKQIVLTSDSHPRDIPSLEERLRSRFEWGLITVIETPEVETRIAILRKKSEELGINHLPDDVAMFIADRVTTNIRELEGCLIRALALADLDNTSLSIDLVKEALKDIIPEDEEKQLDELITAESIQKTVAKYFSVKPSDLRSRKRHKTFTLPRHVAMYLCRSLTNLSLIDIGREFGRKDHTTVIHACNKIEESIKEDKNFEKAIEQIIEEIRNYQD